MKKHLVKNRKMIGVRAPSKLFNEIRKEATSKRMSMGALILTVLEQREESKLAKV